MSMWGGGFWSCPIGHQVPEGADHSWCPSQPLSRIGLEDAPREHGEPVTVESGPEVSTEPGDLRAQPTYPITYYMALPIRLAREESGGPVVSMFCTMRHHTQCTGFTQFRGELQPCDCSWCEHDSIELEEEVA